MTVQPREGESSTRRRSPAFVPLVGARRAERGGLKSPGRRVRGRRAEQGRCAPLACAQPSHQAGHGGAEDMDGDESGRSYASSVEEELGRGCGKMWEGGKAGRGEGGKRPRPAFLRQATVSPIQQQREQKDEGAATHRSSRRCHRPGRCTRACSRRGLSKGDGQGGVGSARARASTARKRTRDGPDEAKARARRERRASMLAEVCVCERKGVSGVREEWWVA